MSLKITYSFGLNVAGREKCRAAGEHDWPLGGKDGHEKPGDWPCRRACGVVKNVREVALR